MTEKTNVQSSYGKFVIDDGTVTEKVYNKVGQEIGTFIFRPTDLEAINRYDEVVEKFADIVAPLDKIGLNPDGTADAESGEEGVKLLNEVRDNLVREFNYIFDTDFAESFFNKRSPFTLINGDFYCGNVLEAIGVYISRAFNTEVKKVNKKYDRYTQGYHGQRTGKHRNGGKKGSK